MPTLTEALSRLENLINLRSPHLAKRLQPGLTHAEIDEQIEDFSWTLPEEVYELYQWHNGLSSGINATSLQVKSLTQKDQWYKGLSGQPSQINLKYGDHLIAAKFAPLEFALAGYSHLKLGKCPFDLLPIFVLNNSKSQNYCVAGLGKEHSAIYFLNGTRVPPSRIDEKFLSTQVKFNNLVDLILSITDCCECAVKYSQEATNSQEVDSINFDVDKNMFEQIYQNYSGLN